MHIAVIMDGNGRWATRRHLPRTAGHRAGAKSVDTIVEAAARRRIQTLTLYAFSAANWRRPSGEITGLMTLFRRYLVSQTPRCVAQSIRVNVIGRRDRLSRELCDAIERSEQATAHCCGMHLRIAVDYSAQYSLMEAYRRAQLGSDSDRCDFVRRLGEVDHSILPAPAVDLLIRTGGEQRLSDFLLWECAYAELYFVDCAWPDFDERAFAAALEEYGRRERRFGGLGAERLIDAPVSRDSDTRSSSDAEAAHA
jgi:undecaprenyl diphosphate synthase